jgi:hypothetical protein
MLKVADDWLAYWSLASGWRRISLGLSLLFWLAAFAVVVAGVVLILLGLRDFMTLKEATGLRDQDSLPVMRVLAGTIGAGSITAILVCLASVLDPR